APGVGPKGPTFAGAAFLSVSSGDVSGLFIGARTSSPGGGGRYGLFYTGVPYGSAATSSAWLYGLQQTASDRTNLALVNTGEADGSTDVFRIDLYDGASGLLTKTIDGTALGPRKWTQITTVLSQYAPGTSNAYARVTRTSGGNPFVAYAVVNDGAAPGQRSGDGAFVGMDVGMTTAPSVPSLEVLPSALDFGGVLVGSSRDLSLTVRNKGTGVLTGSVSSGAPFSVVSGGSFSLGAGASQAVTVRFAPSGSGAASGAASVASNGGNASVPLSGTGTSASAPAIDVTPSSLDFGSVVVGQSKDLTLTVRNVGSATLTVSSLAVGGAFSVPSPATPFNVSQGATQSVTVRFSPPSAGGQSATLTIASNDPARPSVSVALQGQGTSTGTTEELGTDDGTLEGGAVGDGILIVNRLTPTRYPATLKTIRAFFTTFEGLPSPVGATIQLVAFVDPNSIGEPMSNPTKLVDVSTTVPAYQGEGSYVDFPIVNGPTITTGDFYVGFMSPNPYGGVAYVIDTNGDQKRRGFYSFNQGGTFSLLKVPNSFGQPKDANVAIHAVVSSP
ncbi:MAG TPA: choice-of-anchor D domain-containing protein, partial [Thermoanaerobaculia bacterium]|nr:choice-of-anchor D domain-containing protein [Thermoanaerobaculia bacterium]